MKKKKNFVNGRPVTPVEEIPRRKFLSDFSREEKLKYGLDTVYRKYMAIGLGASRKEPTWNKVTHSHDCCGCRSPWRHFANCSKALRNCPDDLSDLKDL